jgi:hypothetical protein
MRIPVDSSILIIGSHPVALAFASVLSACGLKVLVIDELELADSTSSKLILDQYSLGLMAHLGYNIPNEANNELNQADFIKQSLKLLATNLCSVLWNVELVAKPGFNAKTYLLKHNGEVFEHESEYCFTSEELLIDPLNDALNFRNIFLLAWRLIGIINKNLDAKILNSYPEERAILKNQYPYFTAPKNQFQRFTQKLFAPKKKEINIIGSKICLHLSQHRNMEAGELLPNLDFYDEKLNTQEKLYKWCNYRHFSVFLFGYLTTHHLFTVARWIQLNYSVQLFYLPPSKKNQAVFDAFEIKEGERKTLIIRPDRYIGLIKDAIDLDIIDNYLKNLLLMKPKVAEKQEEE